MKCNSLILILILLSLNCVFSQNKKESKYYNLFDSYVEEENFGAFNGREYLDIYPEEIRTSKTNNKFYGSYDFVSGYVLYDGQPYYDIKFKYELVNDLLLIAYTNERVNLLALNSKMVEEFELIGHKFKRLPNNSGIIKSVYRNGFFKEEYVGSEFSLYSKHIKKVVEKLTENKITFDFRDSKYFIAGYRDVYYQISTKKSFLEAFPLYEKTIKYFYKKNSALRRNNKEKFYLNLLKYLDNLSSHNESK